LDTFLSKDDWPEYRAAMLSETFPSYDAHFIAASYLSTKIVRVPRIAVRFTILTQQPPECAFVSRRTLRSCQHEPAVAFRDLEAAHTPCFLDTFLSKDDWPEYRAAMLSETFPSYDAHFIAASYLSTT
jgi:hypothetical protein